jgi:hypothetical protein
MSACCAHGQQECGETGFVIAAENLELPQNFKHLRIQLADVDTQNIAPYFNASYAFVEEGRAAGHGNGFYRCICPD